MNITNPKLEIAQIIKNITVDGLDIAKYHKKPKTFTKLPAITYSQSYDGVKRHFDNDIREKASFQIDVWADKSSEVSKIVIETKKAMLLNGFYYENGYDFDDPSEINRFIMFFERR